MTTRAALHRRIRRRATIAALLVGALELMVLVVGAWSLVGAGLLDASVLLRTTGTALAAVLPWWLGAATLLRAPRVGTAVLLTAGAVYAFHLPGVLLAVPWMIAEGGEGRFSIAVALLRLVLVVAVVRWTWRVRPLVGWTAGDRRLPRSAWILAVLAAMTTVTVPFTWGSGVGGSSWAALEPPANLSSAVWAVATAALYLSAVAVARRWRWEAAGAVLLVVAGPPALVAVSDLLAAAARPEVVLLPLGTVAVAGLVGLAVLGVLVLVRAGDGDETARHAARPRSRMVGPGDEATRQPS